MRLLPLELPSLSNGGYQDQLTGVVTSDSAAGLFCLSIEVAPVKGQDAGGYRCSLVNGCGPLAFQWVAISGLLPRDGKGDFLCWRVLEDAECQWNTLSNCPRTHGQLDVFMEVCMGKSENSKVVSV